MSVSLDSIAARLEREVGAAAVQVEEPVLAAHAVDGMRPRVVCAPAAADQIAAVLRLCGEGGAAVTPWGGGTAIALGNVPHRVDVVLRTDRLAALGEHDDANLTATVQAGMTVTALNARLGGRRQFLALDPPHPARATVGGVVAANTNGPRRMSYGGVRDLVIGMKMVLAGGDQIKAGGKVVKNVAGYDMCKLFTGSLGTLGIITEVTFKMTPQPEVAATVLGQGTLSQAMRVVDGLFASVLQPSAMMLSTALDRSQSDTVVLAVAVEGFIEAVDRHLRDIHAMAVVGGMEAQVLRGRDHDAVWARVRDFPASSPEQGARSGGEAPHGGREVGAKPLTGERGNAEAADVVIRLTVPLGSVGGGLAAIAELPGGRAAWVAHAGAGVIFIRLSPASASAAFEILTRFAQSHHGHAVIMAAPPEVKRGLDVWGPPPAALSIMREIKRQFDPLHLLNPGRFVAFL